MASIQKQAMEQSGQCKETSRHEPLLSRVSHQARRYVNEVLDYGIHNTRSAGFSVRLERDFSERFGRRYGILHANGTATMHTALLAAGVGAGDEVIVPDFTVFMTASVALYANAVPIVADVDPNTWTIDPEDVRRKITPRTKAIIPVSICGLAPDYDPLMEIAREHNLTLIEDNAQCFLGYYKKKLVGSFGDFASFSFQGSKHMTCGDGGILICDDEKLAQAARKAAVMGFSTLTANPGDLSIPKEQRCHPSFARHTELGYNYRMPELAAAMALGELERLDDLVAMRRFVAECFEEVVSECDWLVPQRVPKDYVHSYWTYACRIDRDDLDWSEMRKKFVELGGHGYYGAYLPVHREPVFAALSERVSKYPRRYPHWAGVMPDYREVECPVWEAIQPRVVMLKTNYFDPEAAHQQADILAQTIRFFN